MAGEIRSVSVDDAPAIHAIYAPYVAETVISFEATPPSIEEIAARIQKNTAKYPWLVYMADGAADGMADRVANGQKSGAPALAGYVYASSHRERAAYQWSVDVSVYMNPAYQRRGIGRGLYTTLF